MKVFYLKIVWVESFCKLINELIFNLKKMTNQDLLKIAQDFGSPVYVYDTEKIAS
jgi:hypothetical protein